MKRGVLYAFIITLIFSCSKNYEKEGVAYGNEIFLAEYDAIMSNDKISLYDNDLFHIVISNTSANGNYKIKADTLILDYFISNDLFASAYLLKGSSGWIEPLTQINGNWVNDSTADSGLSTSKNELHHLNFKLSYSNWNLFSKAFTYPRQPVIYVNNNKITYIIDDNKDSFGRVPLGPDTLWTGNFKPSSIDAIINLIKNIKDSVIYADDRMIGRIQNQHKLNISNNWINVKFSLYNSLNPTSEKIIEILNANIPDSILSTPYFIIPSN